jgi:hypothetical protein
MGPFACPVDWGTRAEGVCAPSVAPATTLTRTRRLSAKCACQAPTLSWLGPVLAHHAREVREDLCFPCIAQPHPI